MRCRRHLSPVHDAKVRGKANTSTTEGAAQARNADIWGNDLDRGSDERRDDTAVQPSLATEMGTDGSCDDTRSHRTGKERAKEKRLSVGGDGVCTKGRFESAKVLNEPAMLSVDDGSSEQQF